MSEHRHAHRLQGTVELGHGFLHQGHGLLEIVVDRLFDRLRLEPPGLLEEAIDQAPLVALRRDTSPIIMPTRISFELKRFCS